MKYERNVNRSELQASSRVSLAQIIPSIKILGAVYAFFTFTPEERTLADMPYDCLAEMADAEARREEGILPSKRSLKRNARKARDSEPCSFYDANHDANPRARRIDPRA